MPTRRRAPARTNARSDLDDALDGLRDLGDVVSSLGRGAQVSAGSVRALAEDGVRALGVSSTSTQRILADLIATLAGASLGGFLPFGGRGGGGSAGLALGIADSVGDIFSSAAPAGPPVERASPAPIVNLQFSSVVSDRRALDRHVREEIEPRLRALWASRTRAGA